MDPDRRAALAGFHTHHRETRDLDLPRATLGATTILVDTPHQLLVNKLCALLSRSELRDLVERVVGVAKPPS